MSVFAGKTLMITGGTGSFGTAVLNRFIRTDIGDVRSLESVRSAMPGTDYIRNEINGIKTIIR